MAFDFSTLVTDRTMADVLARNAKGTYNAADLNRVDACLEDLVARLWRMGYSVPGYQRVKLQRSTKPASRLPDGYTEVQYIQSTGTQYVDTGFKPNQNTKIIADVQISNTKCHVFGARTSWKNNAFALYWASNAGECIQLADANFNGGTFEVSVRHVVNMSASEFYMDGVQKASYSVANFQCAQNAWLMSCYSSSASEYAQGDLYSCQIYDAGTLIRDYVPCISPAGAVGLYDLVDGKFYGNAGSGNFEAGPAVALPEEPAEELDPYTWYESDVPTASQMAQYRGNVAAVRAVLQLPEGTPEPPGTMAQLTTAGANSMEAVLLAIDIILSHIPAAVRHCGVTVCGSKGVIA